MFDLFSHINQSVRNDYNNQWTKYQLHQQNEDKLRQENLKTSRPLPEHAFKKLLQEKNPPAPVLQKGAISIEES